MNEWAGAFDAVNFRALYRGEGLYVDYGEYLCDPAWWIGFRWSFVVAMVLVGVLWFVCFGVRAVR